MKSVQKGFTLIELMIVIAIIGILAAIAIPAYQNYTVRAQVSEGSSLIGGLETAFDECYANKGTAKTPCDTNTNLGVTKVISGTYVSKVSFSNPGQITVTYGANANTQINGKTVIWTAFVSGNGDISWVCNDETEAKSAIAGPPVLTQVVGGTAPADGTIFGVNPSFLPGVCK